MVGSLGAGGTWLPSGVFSPPPSSATSSQGEEALGGLSLKDGAWPSVAECEGVATPMLECMALNERRGELFKGGFRKLF